MLAVLAESLGAEVINPTEIKIKGVNALDAAGESDLSFVSSAEHGARLADSRAAAVLVSKPLENCTRPQLVVDNVDKALIAALHLFAPRLTPIKGIAKTAVIDSSARIGKNVAVGDFVRIEPGAVIGDNCILSTGCYVGENTEIGENTRLDAGVVIYHNCKIGKHCVIQANCVIGSIGFGYCFIDGRHQLVPHNGGVIIEDAVETGGGCCVDRAKFGNTVIGAGTKLDNLVHIAHNVKIGKCCLIAGQVGLSGSCELGNGVAMGGQVGLADHVKLSDGVMCGAQSGIVTNFPPGEKVIGSPAQEYHQQMKVWVILRKLPDMHRELKELRKKVQELETAKDHKK